MPPSLLEVEGLEGGYGDVQVLRGVSINLESDERVGLLGPNGAGKTTLLETISGLNKPWKGEIRFEGELINGLSPRRVVDLGIIHVPQGNIMFPRMTVLENLYTGAFVRRVWVRRKERLDLVFDLFPRLAERRSQLAKTLSGGERQMLAVGAGLMAEGKVLLLDELTMGLSPLVKGELALAIDKIAKSGIPMILVDQDFDFLSKLTDRFYMIEEGKVVFEGTPGSVDSSKIVEMYFGGARIGDGHRA